jgi:HK97 family phage prohead protease
MNIRISEDIRKATSGRQSRTGTAELRTAGDEFALVGYATLYNNLSHNLGGFLEIIMPGAFSRTLKDAELDCKCLFNHDPSKILGRTKSGTLTLSEDARGLKYRCELDPNNSDHKNLYSAIKRGDISECSFSFRVPDGGQQWTEGIDPDSGEACPLRMLTDVNLLDVSPVCFPAYPNTAVSARARSKTNNSAGDSRIAQIRKLAQMDALVRGLIPAKRDAYKPGDYNYPPYNYASLEQHLNSAAEFCEAAYAMSSTVGDILDAWDEDDGDRSKRAAPYNAPYYVYDEKSHKAFSESHAASHEGMKEACDRIAACRMALMRCMAKKK